MSHGSFPRVPNSLPRVLDPEEDLTRIWIGYYSMSRHIEGGKAEEWKNEDGKVVWVTYKAQVEKTTKSVNALRLLEQYRLANHDAIYVGGLKTLLRGGMPWELGHPQKSRMKK